MRGLRGVWGADTADLEERLAKRQKRIEATKLVVLSWGPGETRPQYAKREQIAAAVAGLPGVVVVTSEALGRYAAPPAGVPTMSAEELDIDVVDLAICLAVDDPTATGVAFEVSSVRDKPWWRDRIRLFSPKAPRHHGGLLREAIRLFPENQSLRYTPTQYKNCVDIRAMAVQWVKSAQIEKYHRARIVEEYGRLNNG